MGEFLGKVNAFGKGRGLLKDKGRTLNLGGGLWWWEGKGPS